MDLVGDRDRLLEWARAKGDDGIVDVPGDEERRRASTACPGLAA